MKLLLAKLLIFAFLIGTSSAYAGMCEPLKPEGGGTVASDLIGEDVIFEFFLNSAIYTMSQDSNIGGTNTIVDENNIEIIGGNGSGVGFNWDINDNNILKTTFVDNNSLIEDLGAGDTITYFVTFPNLTNKTVTADFGPNNKLSPAEIQSNGTNGFVITATADGVDSLGFSTDDELEVIINVQEGGGATQEEIDAYNDCLEGKIQTLTQNIANKQQRITNKQQRITQLQHRITHLQNSCLFSAKKKCKEKRIENAENRIEKLEERIEVLEDKIAEKEAKIAELEALKL